MTPGRDDFPATRSMSARSIMLSALMGTERGLTPQLLVRFVALFDISIGTARVALSRMVQSGEVELSGGRYRLVGRLDERRRRQDLSRRVALLAWDGTWETWVVKSGQRDQQDRQALRSSATKLQLAELREGVWMRPSNLMRDPTDADHRVLTNQCDALVARPQADPSDIANRLWDLLSWASIANDLARELAEAGERLAQRGDRGLVAGFLLSAGVLRHLVSDPLLPSELLPAAWPGDLLRAEFEAFDGRWQGQFRAWARSSES